MSEFEAEVGADGGEDVVGFEGSDVLAFEVAEGFLDHGEVGLLSGEFDERGDASDGAFEFADVLGDASSDPGGGFFGGDEACAEHESAEDLGAGGGVWGVDADDHT